jgi:hypothetical protein
VYSRYFLLVGIVFSCLMASLFAVPQAVFGADAGPTGWSRENKFTQRISWKEQAGALRYGILVQKEDGGLWNDNTSFFTAKNSCELNLKGGNYRFSITVYDYFEHESGTSGWVALVVEPALQPAVSETSPASIELNDDALSKRNTSIRLFGVNLLPDSQVSVLPAVGKSDKASAGGVSAALPIRVRPAGGELELSIPTGELKSGFYDIIVHNPGGLESIWRNFEVFAPPVFSPPPPPETRTVGGFADERFFVLREAWTPLMPLFGLAADAFGGEWSLIGVQTRFAFMFLEAGEAAIGLEIEGNWNSLSEDFLSQAGGPNFFVVPLNLVLERSFFKRNLTLGFRVGAGVSFLNGFERGGVRLANENADTIMAPIFQAGVLAELRIFKNLFLDLGADYVQVFLIVKNTVSGFLRPSASITVKF